MNSSELTIAILDPNDIETHLQMRQDFIREMMFIIPDANREAFDLATRKWMETHLREGRYIGYAAYLDGVSVAAAGMLLYTLPPLPHALDRRVGHILNVFTDEPYRRRGFASRLLEFIKADAKRRGIVRLFLNAAPMGEPIYRKAGFEEQHEKALVLELS